MRVLTLHLYVIQTVGAVLVCWIVYSLRSLLIIIIIIVVIISLILVFDVMVCTLLANTS